VPLDLRGGAVVALYLNVFVGMVPFSIMRVVKGRSIFEADVG
jgi:hypothetical protein